MNVAEEKGVINSATDLKTIDRIASGSVLEKFWEGAVDKEYMAGLIARREMLGSVGGC
jgi:hypothetical protein